MSEQLRLRRTTLYASGASPVNMSQAPFYNEDCLVYDLEDSVPLAEKDAARFVVYNTVRYHRPKNKEIIIRINGIYTPFFEEDIQATVRARPDALRIPKLEYAKEVKMVSEKIAAVEKAAGIEVGTTKMWCNIESHFGLAHAYEIATADPRVVVLSLGAEDFTVSMKSQRTKAGLEIFYARNALVMACRMAGVDVQDAVFSDFDDLEGLKEDTKLTKNLGFDGRTVVHPRQIDVVNEFFTPSQKEINYAIRVFDIIEEGKRRNKGAIALDGSMIDAPMITRARRILALAKAAGIKVEGDYYDR